MDRNYTHFEDNAPGRTPMDEESRAYFDDYIRAGKLYLKNRRFDRAYLCLRGAYTESKKESVPFMWEVRTKIQNEMKNGGPSTELYKLLRQSWFLQAADNFEAFMIAMEWDRVPNARFWLPRRKVLEGRFGLASTIQEFIDNDKMKKLALSLPPGTGKSTLIKFLLSYIAGKWPKSQNMYCSYSDGMIKMMIDSVFEMTTGDEYNFKEIFNHSITPTKSAEYNTLSFRTRGDFPTIGMVSLGGSVTGRTRANTFFITDDLVKNDEVARSPERLQTLYNDYTNTLTTRMIGPSVKEIMLGTIWSIHDPISRQKKQYDGRKPYKFISLPVCDEYGHTNFDYDTDDKYTDEMIADLKTRLDPVVFSCLYMQRGVEKEGLAFGHDRLKFYNGVLPDGEPDNIFFYADVAWGGGDSFSMPIAYQYGGDVYIHDVLFDKGDKSITKPRVVGKILQHKIRMGEFEANNGGEEYCDDISRILREIYEVSVHLTSRKAKSNMSKLARIEQHQDTIRTFYFRGDSGRGLEYNLFMQELEGFSFTSKNLHDDAPDSLAGMSEYRYSGTSSATIRKRPY